MPCKVLWTEQVEHYVRQQAPLPRAALWAELKALGQWDGRENPPHIRHLEDDLAGYSRVRIKNERIIFRQDYLAGQRVIKCLYAGPRKTIYEAFQEVFLDDLST